MFDYRVITESMSHAFAFNMAFLVLAHMTIGLWAILPFIEATMRLPIPAR